MQEVPLRNMNEKDIIHILCVLTPSHRDLFGDFFIKTIPCPENVLVKRLHLEGEGNYKSNSWQIAVNAKTEFVISYLKEVDDNTIFVFSDVDIQFFPDFSLEKLKRELIESDKDILFQKASGKEENYEVNAGFFIAKSSNRLLKFFEDVLRENIKAKIKSDQRCINFLLPNSMIKWGFLSFRYYSRSHGFPPPQNIYYHHATYAVNPEMKKYQMKLVRRYYNSGYIGKKLLLLIFNIRNKGFKLLRNRKKII